MRLLYVLGKYCICFLSCLSLNLWIILLFISLNGLSQNVSFKASIDAKEVLEGNYFQITFKLENAQGGQFAPPSFKDFTVLSGPNRSSQMSIINGRTSQSMSFSYNLLAPKPGTFSIGPGEVKVGSQKLRSNSISVKVVKAAKAANIASNANEEVFIEVELSDSVAYVGQQVTLKYVIFSTVDVRSFNFINENEYNGFYVEDLQNFKDQATKVVRNGKQYVRQTLKAIALFPQQTGITEIGPSMLNLGIAIKSERPSFFFSTSMRSKRITTPTKTIRILNTPGNPPLSFSGAIGRFKITASVDKTSIPIDGAITLTMRIEGDGDARFVSPPQQQFEGFEVYDPNLLNQDKRVINGRINGTKTYEYLLVPKESGVQTIIPEMTYYNIDSVSFVTLYGSTYSIQVASGSRNSSVSVGNMSAQLSPILTTTKFNNININPLFSRGHLTFLSVCGLAFLMLGGVRWRHVRQGKIDPKVLKSKKAQKLAEAKLAESKIYLLNKDVRNFYLALRKGLFDYVSSKFDEPKANISKESIGKILMQKDLNSPLINRLKELIERSEMAIYAGYTPEKATEDFNFAKEIIIEVEEAFKNAK